METNAYKCHHCQKKGEDRLIFLTKDETEAGFASCVNFGGPDPEKRTAKLKTFEETIEDKRNEIAIAQLDAKLKGIKDWSEGSKTKTMLDFKKEALDVYYDGVVGVREYGRQKKAEAAERYKDNPAALKDALDAIDGWLNDNS